MRITFVVAWIALGACSSSAGHNIGSELTSASGDITVNGEDIPLHGGTFGWDSGLSPALGGDGFSFCFTGGRAVVCLRCDAARLPLSSQRAIPLADASCQIDLGLRLDASDGGDGGSDGGHDGGENRDAGDDGSDAEGGDGSVEAGVNESDADVEAGDGASMDDLGVELQWTRIPLEIGTLSTTSRLDGNGNGSLMIELDVPSLMDGTLHIDRLRVRGTVFFADEAGCRAPPLSIP